MDCFAVGSNDGKENGLPRPKGLAMTIEKKTYNDAREKTEKQ